MITPTTNIADTIGIGMNTLNINSAWWWQNFGKNERAPMASESKMGFAGIDASLFRARDTAVELSIAGNKSNMVEYTRSGKSEQKSNFLVSKCYNTCGVLHPFNTAKRNECRAQCDRDAEAAQQQQEQINEAINQPPSGISSGVIWGIVGGIVLLTIGGVVLIRRMKKKSE